jgi:hypothetical protein
MVAKGSRGPELVRGAALGAAAGLVGVAAMTAGEKLEQVVTGRPSSYVPARALLTLLGRRPSDADRPAGWNQPCTGAQGSRSARSAGCGR